MLVRLMLLQVVCTKLVRVVIIVVDDENSRVVGNRIDVQNIEMKQISTHFRAPVAVLYKATAVSNHVSNSLQRLDFFHTCNSDAPYSS